MCTEKWQIRFTGGIPDAGISDHELSTSQVQPDVCFKAYRAQNHARHILKMHLFWGMELFTSKWQDDTITSSLWQFRKTKKIFNLFLYCKQAHIQAFKTILQLQIQRNEQVLCLEREQKMFSIVSFWGYCPKQPAHIAGLAQLSSAITALPQLGHCQIQYPKVHQEMCHAKTHISQCHLDLQKLLPFPWS